MTRKLRFDFLTVVISILIYAGFVFFTNPALHYYTQQIGWLSNLGFLKISLGFAGGTGEYVSLFLSQFFHSKLAGSIIIVALAIFSVFLLWRVLNSIQTDFLLNLVWVSVFPIVMAGLLFNYRFYFSVFVNIGFVLTFLYLQTHFKSHEKLNNLWILISGILLYYISGGAYLLIYMTSSMILVFAKKDKIQWLSMALCLSIAVAVPFFFYKFIFPVSIEQAYFKATPDVAPMLRYTNRIIIFSILSYVPVVIIITAAAHFRIFAIQYWLKKTSFIFLLMATGYTAAWFLGYKPHNKIKAEIEFYAYSGIWDKVVELAGSVEEYDRTINFQFNRAISHQGELLDKLFNYPQLLGTQGLFLDKPFSSEVALPSSDLYFDLGNIDESQRFAFEAQTLTPSSPRVISRLTVNSIILENYNAAKTFCNVLSANPIEKKRIKQILPLIDNPYLAAADPLIAGKRKLMNKPEGVFLTPRDKLLWLLTKNQTNKMAFEYLIAFDLMEHDLTAFTNDIKYFPESGYKKLPVVIEEAVILFLSQRPENSFLKSFRLSQQTTARFKEFVKIVQHAKGDKIKAKQAASKFKNTYWYYVLFTSPLVTKVQVETRPSEANY